MPEAESLSKPLPTENATPLPLRVLLEVSREASPTTGNKERNDLIVKIRSEMAGMKPDPNKQFEGLRLGNGQKIKEEDRSQVVNENGKASDNLQNLSETGKEKVETMQKLVDDVVLFSQIMREAEVEGVPMEKIEEIAKRHKVNNWNQFSKELAKRCLEQTPFFKREYEKNTDANKLAEIYIEAVLQDPRLAQELVSSYESLIANLKSIEMPQKPKNLEEKEKEKNLRETTYKKLIDKLNERWDLDEAGIDEILQLYPGGDISAETFTDEVLRLILKKGGKDGNNKIETEEEIGKIEKYLEGRDELNGVQAEIKELEVEGEELGSNEKSRRKPQIKKRIKDLEQKQKKLQNELKSFGLDDKKITFYEVVTSRIKPSDNKEGGIVSDLITNYKRYLELEDQISDLQSSEEDYQKKMELRKRQEEEFLENFGNIFNNSVVNLLMKRSQEVQTIRQKLIEGEKDEVMRKFLQDYRKRYVDYDPESGRNTYYPDNIGEDMRILANYPDNDDGLRIIIAQRLGFKITKDSNSYSINTSDHLQKLTKEQKSQIDRILTDKKGEMLATLFESYAQAKMPWDLTLKIPGFKRPLIEGRLTDMALSEEQWIRLGKAYGEQVKEAFRSVKGGKDILKKIEQSGAKPGKKWENIFGIAAALALLGVLIMLFKSGGS